MRIDCDSCTARGDACADCVVTVLLGAPPDDAVGPAAGLDVSDGGVNGVELSDDDRAAIDVLADSGLVPPLRMRAPVDVPRYPHLRPVSNE